MNEIEIFFLLTIYPLTLFPLTLFPLTLFPLTLFPLTLPMFSTIQTCYKNSGGFIGGPRL
jgi:hypothetical protein